MLVLFETAAGFALFKVLDEGKLKNTDDLYKDFETPSKAGKVYVWNIVLIYKFHEIKNKNLHSPLYML